MVLHGFKVVQDFVHPQYDPQMVGVSPKRGPLDGLCRLNANDRVPNFCPFDPNLNLSTLFCRVQIPQLQCPEGHVRETEDEAVAEAVINSYF